MASATLTFPHLTGAIQTSGIEMDASLQDLGLVQRMISGDESAVSEMYALYGQRLYAFALRLTDDPSLAQDVTQETLVTAWRTAAKFRGESRLITWLLGIVHHKAMKLSRHKSRSLDEMNEPAITSIGCPEEEAQISDRERWLRQGLQSLSAEHRAVLELVFYQGMTLKEVAEVCGCPLGTVKSRLSYARSHLRSVLSRAGEDW